MPASWFLFHADGVARHQQSGHVAGKRDRIVQAYADVYNDHLRLRAGEFWLPTSRENTDPLWTSKYTITYSALNSWMAQEVRPIGADLQWSPSFYVTVGATAFRGNDTMGTLLAGRGWTFGNYLAAYNENLPTPGPRADPPVRRGSRRQERLRRTHPRVAARTRHAPVHAHRQPRHARSRPGQRAGAVADALQHRRRRSRLDGADPPSPREWMRGSTAVGFPGGSFTMDFDTAYLLGSHKFGHERLSARIERFATSNASHPVRRLRPRTRPRLDHRLDARDQPALPRRPRILPRLRRPPRPRARLRSAHGRIDGDGGVPLQLLRR